MTEIYAFTPGDSPLLVSMPHVGTRIPDEVARDMTEAAHGVPDTDWHVDRLYDFLPALGASILRATHSRFVIDLNRPPGGKPLYPGASNTELCPTTLFDDGPIYRVGAAPGPAEIAERLDRYWRPYHERLAQTLEALRRRHGYALLFDAHSIRSEVPRFFAGRLPDINLGTGGGASASPLLAARLLETAQAAHDYTSILDGRFTGGYITRHYGRPGEGVHAVQLELAQRTYMEERPPFAFREERAAGIRPVLRRIVEAMLDWAERARGRLAVAALRFNG
jgi:N-formylglutamate deformylase